MTTPAIAIMPTGPTSLRTCTLAQLGYSDLAGQVEDPALMDPLREMLHHFGVYQVETETALQPGDRLPFGYWAVHMQRLDEAALAVWESTPDGTELVPVATYTLRLWRDQSTLCQEAGAAYLPPTPRQMIALSAGVLDGDGPVSGVRYAAPPHMSGWYLTTDRYDGEIASMRVEHVYHLTAARPDLARFIGLPPGYRFTLDKDTEEVWFDEEAAAQ